MIKRQAILPMQAAADERADLPAVERPVATPAVATPAVATPVVSTPAVAEPEGPAPRRGLPALAWLILLALMGAAVAAGVIHFRPFQAAPPAPPPVVPPVAVSAATVGAAEVTDKASFIGSLDAVSHVSVSAYSAGHVTQIMFQDGERVEKGALLVQLDDRVAQAELAAAKAQLASKQAQLGRDSTLRKEGFATQTSLETSQTDVEQARTQVASRESDLRLLSVLAPFAGTLGESKVSLGEYVTPGQTLVDLVDLTRMTVAFRVPERALVDVEPGAKVSYVTDAFPDRTFVGAVGFTGPQIDPKTRSFLVRAELDVPSRELRPGLFGHVELTLGQPRHAVVVPDSALVRQLTGSFVYKIVDGHAELTPVELGSSDGGTAVGMVEIAKGLVAGDRIVTSGQFKLRDGDPVVEAPAGAAAAPQA